METISLKEWKFQKDTHLLLKKGSSLSILMIVGAMIGQNKWKRNTGKSNRLLNTLLSSLTYGAYLELIALRSIVPHAGVW